MALKHIFTGPYLEEEVARLRTENERLLAQLLEAGKIYTTQKSKQDTPVVELPPNPQSPEEAAIATEVGGLSWLTDPLSSASESSWERYNRLRFEELAKDAKQKKFIVTEAEVKKIATAQAAEQTGATNASK